MTGSVNARPKFRRVATTLAAVVAVIVAGRPVGASSPEVLKAELAAQPALTQARYEATSGLTGQELADALDIHTVRFESAGTLGGQPVSRIAPEDGDDPSLAYCGHSGTGTMVARFGLDLSHGYCITGIMEGDPTSVFYGRSIAMRLLDDSIPTETQSEILALRMQILFNKGADGIELSPGQRTEVTEHLDQLWRMLSPEEKAFLAEGPAST